MAKLSATALENQSRLIAGRAERRAKDEAVAKRALESGRSLRAQKLHEMTKETEKA